MVRTFGEDNFDVLFNKLMWELSVHPQFICEPRGMKIKELIAPTLVLRNPRARLLNYKARKADYGFAVGEFLWYWNGRQDLESLLYYNKRAAAFSDDGKRVNSAYGYRTRKFEWDGANGTHDIPRITQWEACKKALIADQDSRRALLIINFPGDNTIAAVEGSKDVPCTLSLQFFIRGNRLHLHSHMRSNDAIWGLTYDLFSFTLLQEAMMLELNRDGKLGLDVGEYIHTAGSLHLYEQHFDMAIDIVKEITDNKEFRHAAAMEPLDLKGLSLLASLEEPLRTGKVETIDTAQFRGGVRWMAEQLNAHRRKRDAERG